MIKKPKQYSPLKSKKRKFTFHKSGRAKGYDSDWEKYRRRFLYHNPNCYCCPDRSNVVDHVIPAKVDFEKYFWNETNFIPLCKHCHDTITGLFDRHAEPKTDEKMQWINKQRAQYSNRTKVKVVTINKR